MNRIDSFKSGIRDGISIGLGYLSVSFAFGIIAVGSGLSILEAVMI
jgi:predicted branched-subunit amino acid permease